MVLGVVVIAAVGCRGMRPRATSTQLPAGYRHEGIKRVFLCAVGDAYEDQLAMRAVHEALKNYSGLFVEVRSQDEAEMVLQVSGVQGRAAQSGGVGVGVGPVGISGGSGILTPSTELGVAVSLKPTGEVVYQNLVVLPQHPNVGMPKAAAKVFAAYANGR